MPDGGLRVYFGSRDDKGVGRIGYADLDPRDPTRILRHSAKPVFDIGRPGCFDDNGVLPTCAIWRGSELWLYYAGYQLGVKVRYVLFSGLAISRDGGEFHPGFRRRRSWAAATASCSIVPRRLSSPRMAAGACCISPATMK